MTRQRPPFPIRPLLAALALPLCCGSAAASERWWTYIGGCSGADWQGLVTGTNAQGAATCWATSQAGLSGAAPPTVADNVFFRTSGPTDLSVSFAAASRPSFTGRAAQLDITGTGTGYAGLTLPSHLPAATTLEVNALGLGVGGRGEVQQAGGRVVVSGRARLGLEAGNSGRYTLHGGTLQVSDTMQLGLLGHGSYLQTGGQATIDTLLLAAARMSTAQVQVSGGTLTARRMSMADRGWSTLTISGTGQVSIGSLFDGPAGTANRSDVTVTGPEARLNISGSADFSTGGTGTLTVSHGGQVITGTASLGALPGSRGEALVAGGGAHWSIRTTLTVGGEGAGLLTVGSGGTVEVASMQLGAEGHAVLDGGQLRMAAGIEGPGRFEWRSGTLFTGQAGGVTTLGSVMLPTGTVLATGQHLRVDGTLAVGGGLLGLAGGTLQADALTLAGGTVVTVGAGAFDVGSVGHVSGHGTLAAPVRGAAGTRLVATGGALAAGQLTRDDGFDFDGTLTVQGGTVVLLDRNGARLGETTQLLDGGRLASATGLTLEAGRTLQFSGAALVEGRFTHQGAVAPAAAGTLTFDDDVTGPGSFAGSVIFRGLYAPGAAAVDFGGGTLRLGASGELVLRIDDLAPGSFSRLAGIGTLQADNAALALAFAPGLALPDAGMTLVLLDFAAFGGGFDPARVRISGIDAQRLDLSRLAVDGTVAITPVPEPGTVAMMLAGLAALGWRGRRKG